MFVPHIKLVNQAILRPRIFEFRDQMLEGLLLDSGKDNLAHRTIRFLEHGLCHAKKNLHLAFHTLDVMQQFAIELPLCDVSTLRIKIQHHPDNIVSNFRRADVR